MSWICQLVRGLSDYTSFSPCLIFTTKKHRRRAFRKLDAVRFFCSMRKWCRSNSSTSSIFQKASQPIYVKTEFQDDQVFSESPSALQHDRGKSVSLLQTSPISSISSRLSLSCFPEFHHFFPLAQHEKLP